jgi:hypothetical protein
MNEYQALQIILGDLKAVVQREGTRHMMDQHLTPSMLSLLEDEIIPMIENELDYDPTPDGLGEPPITAAEIHHAAWVQHQVLHS